MLFFGLLALVGLGAALYRPLRLRYAMYRVEKDYPTTPPDFDWTAWGDKWMCLCLRAAEEGNPRAMEIVCDRCWVSCCIGLPSNAPSDIDAPHPDSVAMVAARAQPQLFLSVLDGKDDREAIDMLLNMLVAGRVNGDPLDGSSPNYLSGNMRRIAVSYLLSQLSCSADPAKAKLGAAVSEYLQRRFPDAPLWTGEEKPE